MGLYTGTAAFRAGSPAGGMGHGYSLPEAARTPALVPEFGLVRKGRPCGTTDGLPYDLLPFRD
jgi:hypothetical protein